MSDENLAELLRQRAPKKRSKVTAALTAVLLILVGVLLGVPLGKAASPAPEAAMPSGAAPSSGNATMGTIDEVGPDAITITTPEGAKVTVLVTAQTAVTSQQAVALESLKAGTPVIITGTKGEDGVITADRISEGGAFGGRSGPPSVSPQG